MSASTGIGAAGVASLLRPTLFACDAKSVDLKRDRTPDARIPIEVDAFLRVQKSVDLNRDRDCQAPRGAAGRVRVQKSVDLNRDRGEPRAS